MKLRLILSLIFFSSLFVSCNLNDDKTSQLIQTSLVSTSGRENAPFNLEEKANAADEAVKKTEALRLKPVISHYRNPNPEFYYDVAKYHAFYEGRKLLKLVEFLGEEGYNITLTYYFDGKRVFFVQNESSYMDSQYLLSKTYLENGKIFKITGKEKEPQDENTTFASVKELTANKDEINRKQKLFKKDYSESLKRFKDSKVE